MSGLTGLILGSILRDIGWYRAIRRTFPFTVRVTDWPLVEKIATDDVP
jgi:hypothetical protein